MRKIYLDNAATTVLDPQVWKCMKPYFLEVYGNPSSAHYAGREAKASLELARKEIAKNIGASSAKLIFTSGATESNNLVFKFAKKDLGVKKVIVSPLEHHAVLNTAQAFFGSEVLYTKHDTHGVLDLKHLEQLLATNKDCLVSVMHANNEIGIINPVKEIARLCKLYGILYHSDTVQSMVHQEIDLEDLDIDFIVCSAHKFHGPKGVGFLAFGQNFKLTPDQFGGVQEKSLRAGTEALPLIIGMSEAMKINQKSLKETEQANLELKQYLIEKLSVVDGISFNGGSDATEGYLSSLLNISLPKDIFNEMTLFTLDLNGIAVSGGSACSSGAIKGSHVLDYIDKGNTNIALRVSFSKYTTKEELDYFVEQLVACSQIKK